MRDVAGKITYSEDEWHEKKWKNCNRIHQQHISVSALPSLSLSRNDFICRSLELEQIDTVHYRVRTRLLLHNCIMKRGSIPCLYRNLALGLYRHMGLQTKDCQLGWQSPWSISRSSYVKPWQRDCLWIKCLVFSVKIIKPHSVALAESISYIGWRFNANIDGIANRWKETNEFCTRLFTTLNTVFHFATDQKIFKVVLFAPELLSTWGELTAWHAWAVLNALLA